MPMNPSPGTYSSGSQVEYTDDKVLVRREGDRFAAISTVCTHLGCTVPWSEAEAAKDWYARIKSRPSFRSLLTDRVPGLKPPEIYADPDF